MMNINQKIEGNSATSAPAGWAPLQHPRLLIGLSRARLTLNDVFRLIDNRQIRWAWDISRPGSGRPEVRIWRQSLLDYLNRENQAAAAAMQNFTLAQVIATVLPQSTFSPRTRTLRGNELQRRFTCSSAHISRLIDDGELSCVGAAGMGRTPGVLYQSTFEFLKRRSLSL